MKALLFPLLAATLLTAGPLRGEDAPDLRSPKAEQSRLLRILLYIPGSSRLIDYPDVERIFRCGWEQIVFETQDGHVVMHRGPYTVIRPPNAPDKDSDGTRFYDPK